ncbi:hypothetical protein VTN77DRAFT_510 [Rasamsonia byssochlamydoides]|uniref:uncharacterized protein n=1 Tax=Rasamsonia byssochlamydoides TaxID=89139 RepID=UPI00374416B1
MGSKTYEGQQQPQDATNTVSIKPNAVGGKPRGTSVLEDGDGNFGSGDDNDDDDDGKDSSLAMVVGCNENEGKKKKSKKSRKKKSKKEKSGTSAGPLKQSSPPRVPLSDLFPTGKYPPGQIIESKNENLMRTTKEELRYLERGHIANEEVLNDYRKAAEVHRQVRQWVQQTVKPGQTLTEIATGIEDGVRALLGHQGIEPGDSLKAGMGFPTGWR